MRPKLLIITQFFPSKADPLRAPYNKQQFERLVELFDIDIVVPVSWVTWVLKRDTCSKPIGSLRPYYFPHFFPPKICRWLYAGFMWLSLRVRRKKIFASRPDIVLVSWAFPDAVAVARLAREENLPFVVKVHGSDVNLHCLYPSRRKQVVAALNQAKAVFSVSAAMKEVLVGHGVSTAKIIVNYNGVDRDRFHPVATTEVRQSLGYPRDTVVFMYLGNLKVAKGAIDIVTAFADVANELGPENSSLVLVGDGEDRGLVEKAVKDARLRCPAIDIRLIGNKPHEQLNGWINAADFVCLPSYAEGVPNSLLEAMACGKPVIATNVGGIPEIVCEDAGILVAAGDTDALAAAMVRASRIQWNAQNVTDSVADFTWEKNTRRLFEAVQDVCNK